MSDLTAKVKSDLPEDAMSQCEWILSQLRAGRILSDADCRFGFSIGRTAARIKNLRDRGHNIITDMVSVEKRNGKTARVGVYRLPA
jgi:hypothetical protein